MLFFSSTSHRKHITTASPSQVFMVRLSSHPFLSGFFCTTCCVTFLDTQKISSSVYIKLAGGRASLQLIVTATFRPPQIFPFYILNEDDDFPLRLHDSHTNQNDNNKKVIKKDIIVVFISSNLNIEIYFGCVKKTILSKRKEIRHFRAKYCRHTN
jgi:hypothetical protein